MFTTIHGVDFSGAKLAGRNTWVARLQPAGRRRFRLTGLDCLEKLAGTAERAAALAHLVRLVAASDAALWALDFPFGLPIEVMDPGSRWGCQFEFLRDWGEDAYGVGLECLRRAQRPPGALHAPPRPPPPAPAPLRPLPHPHHFPH